MGRTHQQTLALALSKRIGAQSFNRVTAEGSSDRTNLSPFTKDYRGLALQCDLKVFGARERTHENQNKQLISIGLPKGVRLRVSWLARGSYLLPGVQQASLHVGRGTAL